MSTFLVLIVAATIHTTPPKMISRHDELNECHVAALRLNNAPEMQTKEVIVTGTKFVCLSIAYPS